MAITPLYTRPCRREMQIQTGSETGWNRRIQNGEPGP